MQGTVSVDFVGTVADARAFATEHGGNMKWNPQLSHFSRQASGAETIAIKYHTPEEMAAAVALFASLQWDEASQLITNNGHTGQKFTVDQARSRGWLH